MEGSKTITTEVTLTDILNRVKDHVYYMGEALKSNPQLVELGAKIQASSDEDAVLKDFISDAKSVVCNLISRVLGLTSSDDSEGTKITFTTKAVANVPDINDQLKDYIINYIAVYVIEGWLKITKPDEAVRFSETKQRLENELTLLATQRTKPVRS